MEYIVHVPQGHSARLIHASECYDIKGLYTDRFSSCNIIVCIGNERIVVVHVDSQMYHYASVILDELNWVGEPNETIFITRKDGAPIRDELAKYFKEVMPDKKFIDKHMDDKHDGIFVSFTKYQEFDLHPQIRKFPLGQRPENLIHHPQEEKFFTVQKIEEIIGLRAKAKTNKTHFKVACIFDGRSWEPLEDFHFKVNTSHPLTEEEMSLFKTGDPCILIERKLAGIIQKAQEIVPMMGDLKDHVMSVAPFVESYLNNFDYELLFKRNIEELFSSSKSVSGYDPVSDEDKILKSRVLELVKTNEKVYREITDMINQYKDESPETEFKENILIEFNIFSRHYNERKYYADLEKARVRKVEATKNKTAHALRAYRERNYFAAANLFLDIMKELTFCYTKAHPDLASTYYNLGRSLFQLGSFEEARFFLKASFDCRSFYVEPKPSSADLEKTRRALEECEQKIAEEIQEEKMKTAPAF